MNEQYGLTLDVYRNAGPDCTARGITSRADRVTLVGVVRQRGMVAEPLPREARVFGERPDAPAVILRHTNSGNGSVCLVPAVWDAVREDYRVVDDWVMAGGNYAGTSDSRFSSILESMIGHRFYGLVAVHDRIEQ